MAEARAFGGLRFDPARVDPALTIAPPYDVISPDEQRALYERSERNIVRIEYGEERAGDSEAENRYTRASRDLATWRRDGTLIRDATPAMYAYTQRFEWDGRAHERQAMFAVVRLEEWERGVIKPHERTLSRPKQDRLTLLRATRTQISPVYGIYRERANSGRSGAEVHSGEVLYDFSADGQHHVLRAVDDRTTVERFASMIAAADVYIADGHHRYETALAYRDEVRAPAERWTGDEPENFVLMALTRYDDPGLLVLPTHRMLRLDARPSEEQVAAIAESFQMTPIASAMDNDEAFHEALQRVESLPTGGGFLALGLRAGEAHLLTLEDRSRVEQRMPADEPEAWKQLDVNVLEYGVLRSAFGIDDSALRQGAVSYTQDARQARRAVLSGEVSVAFILNATPVEQVLAVADAGARMPQKSTFFHPKLPTGLVMNPFD